ncbi:MAG: exosome complex RNA-binding protein Rrp4 [archaeon]
MSESKLLANEKEIVVPGEKIASGMSFIPGYGTYRSSEDIIASTMGIVRVEGKVIKLVSLSGNYLPKTGDVIIGKITDVNLSAWNVDTNSAYVAMLSIKDATSDFIRKGDDLTKYFDIGDYIVTKIFNVTTQNLVDVTMKGPGLRKLIGGRIIKVNPNKVPRIIGKQGSMVSMIKNVTNCQIIVGQNGLIWIKGEPQNEIMAVSAIKKIETESHMSGLTDRIKEFIGAPDTQEMPPSQTQDEGNGENGDNHE